MVVGDHIKAITMHLQALIHSEVLHGRWLVWWLLIVNYASAREVAAWLIMVDVSYTTLSA